MADLEQELQSLSRVLPQRFGATTTNGAATNVAAPAAPAAPPPPIALSAEAVRQLQEQLGVNAPPSGFETRGRLTFQERNQRLDDQGNPIEISETGTSLPVSRPASLVTESLAVPGIFNFDPLKLFRYGRIANQPTPEDKLAVTQKLYPQSKARLLDSGDVVMEVQDSSTGKPKDVVLNPTGVNAHDLVDLSVQAPEIAASIATAIVTQGRGVLKTIAQMVLSSGAGAGAGGLRDAAARAAEGLPVRPGEIASRRGKEAALDVGLQGVGAVGAKGLGVLSPFARSRGPLEFDRDRALTVFKDTYPELGTELERSLTPAQRTGSGVLRKLEATETPQPGASVVLERIKQRQENAVRGIIQRSLGNVPASEQVGIDAMAALQRSVTGPVEQAVSAARADLLSKGKQEVVDAFDQLTGVIEPARVTEFAAGTQIRPALAEKFTRDKAIVDEAYAVVNQLPGGTGDILPGNAAAQAAREIREELPAALKTVTEDTGLVDELGRPLTVEREKRQILSSGVPEGLAKALSDLEALKNAKVSLQTFTNMKRAAFDEIAKTEAVPGVKERWFNKIAAAYESGLQSAIDEFPEGELKTALSNARKEYKARMVPYERQGLADIPRTDLEAGFKSEEELVRRLTTGPRAQHNWRVLKSAIGEDSQAFRSVKRSILDSKLAEATDELTGKIDAAKLESALTDLARESPQIGNDLFQGQLSPLRMNLRSMSLAQKGTVFDAEDLRVLINSQNVSRDTLETLARAETKRAELYVNSLLKDIGEGQSVVSRIKPTELVQRLRSLNTPSADVKQIVDALAAESPETREALSTVVMFQFLDEASKTLPGNAGKKLSAQHLRELTGEPGSDARKRFELLLGDTPLTAGKTAGKKDLVDNLTAFITPTELAEQSFRGSGSISSSMTIQKLFHAPVAYGERYLQKLLLATLYTGKAGRLITNTALNPEATAALANTWIASEPVVRRLVAVAGPEVAQDVVDWAKERVDGFAESVAGLPREQQQLGQMMRGEPAKLETQVVP